MVGLVTMGQLRVQAEIAERADDGGEADTGHELWVVDVAVFPKQFGKVR
ncbi:hypothetical protein BQ8482_200020 [Mesorhizobium delmotii]|uniref:Uncharacterized protein n=1 Tax=Mesorhizobium delmotii TaxID=1631247 RepID=A0A2P9AKX9_9HYPH|nr:hypothetical protein BQ8482_200020 [Mesorhizobium delmotii]